MTRTILLDPTGEFDSANRVRAIKPTSLNGLTVGLLDIAKRKSDVFLDRLESRILERGLGVERFTKQSNAKTASIQLQQEIAHRCDVLIEALAD